MSTKRNWHADGTCVYMPNGGFDIRDCSNAEDTVKLIATSVNYHDDLLDLLFEALPYVEEGEQFNKESRRGLSKKIRAILDEVKGQS